MKNFILALLFLVVANYTSAQKVITYAGNGVRGNSGDGGLATVAQFGWNLNNVIDNIGNLYVIDIYNKVRFINAVTKEIKTIAGNGNFGQQGIGGLAINAELGIPSSIAVDFSGHLYICDSYYAIKVVDLTTGLINIFAGNDTVSGFSGDGGLFKFAKFTSPLGLSFDRNGDLFVIDGLRIRKIDMKTGVINTVVGNGTFGQSGDGGLAVNAELSQPVSLCFDKYNNMYILDSYYGVIRKVDFNTGIISLYAGQYIYYHNAEVVVNQNALFSQFYMPSSIAIDNNDNIFVADSCFIVKIDAQSKLTSRIAGSTKGYAGDGGSALSASFDFINSIALDKLGNIFVADNGNFRIREIMPSIPCNSDMHLKANSVVNCNSIDSCNGLIGINAVGGTPPYKLVFNGVDTLNASSNIYSKLCPSNYPIVLLDSNGCMVDTSISVRPIYPCVNMKMNTVFSHYVAPTNNVCNGSVVVNATGGTKPYNYYWSNSVLGSKDSTLCPNKSYSLTVTDSLGCTSSNIFRTGADSIIYPCKGFSVNISSPSKLTNCNGSASAIVSGGTGPFGYSWSNYFNTPSISSICPGMYSVEVIDNNGCFVTASTSISADTTVASTPLSIYVTTSYASNPLTCNGVAVASAEGGFAPYKFAFSNKNSFLNYDSLLCSGAYQVTVTDKKGTQASMSFVISNPQNTFGDTVTQYVDSFAIATPNTSAASNCLFNYSSVDSVSIINYQMIGSGHDTVLVTWALYNGNTFTPIGLKYAVGKSGIYNFTLQAYCGPTITAKMNGNVVNGYLTAHEKYYINTSATGIAIIGSAGNASSIYPVPFNSTLTVRFGTTDKFTVSIMDVTGKMVIDPILNYTNPECTINLSNLQAGIYFVKVQSSKGGVEFFKAIKD